MFARFYDSFCMSATCGGKDGLAGHPCMTKYAGEQSDATGMPLKFDSVHANVSMHHPHTGLRVQRSQL